MLYRDRDDKLVKICKHDFRSDTEYYKFIIQLKTQVFTRQVKLNMNSKL